MAMGAGNCTLPSCSATSVPAASFDFKLYRYDPSLAGASIAAATFALLTILHVWKIVRCRSVYFTAFAVGGLFQTIGYCGRIWSHFDQTAIGGFVMQAILILVAPALYAASIYMILGRLIRALRAEQLSPIPVKFLTKIFVTGDVVSFLLQAGGGGIQAAGTLELFDIGEKIIITGLFIQIAFFSFFLATSCMFHHRAARQVTEAELSGSIGLAAMESGIPWKKHLFVLYGVSALIMVRSVFRVVEYLQGNGGYLIAHEIFLYIFDACLMALVMLVFLVFYIDDLAPRLGLQDLELVQGQVGEGAAYASLASQAGPVARDSQEKHTSTG